MTFSKTPSFWGCVKNTKGNTRSWGRQYVSQSHLWYFELLIDALPQILIDIMVQISTFLDLMASSMMSSIVINISAVTFWWCICTSSIWRSLQFWAATKQLNEWFFLSVCLSVRLSVCHTFLTMFPSSYHHEILRSYYQWPKHGPYKRSSKVKVTEVTPQINRYQTVTPVWIHIWWWNDAYGLMLLRRGALLFYKVIRQISRSRGSKNCRIWPRLCVSGP